MNRIILTKSEIIIIKDLIGSLRNKYQVASSNLFIENAPYYASELPKRIRQFYNKLKTQEDDSGISVLKGWPVEDLGNTPESWDYESSYRPSLDIDFLSVLLSSSMGDIFGWSTQQKGKLIHDLIPIENKGSAQTGYGSTSELVLHTEDSFHPYKGDYVCMYSIRNQDSIGTTVASIRDVMLEEELKDVLYQKRYMIKPDESHLDGTQLSQTVSDKHLDALYENENKTSVLYGNPAYPYICFDPHYTLCGENDQESRDALDALIIKIRNKTQSLVLKSGDICIIDNRKVVHGRGSFKPRYDGKDRWLKRISITNNLRKSVSSRESIESRIIG